MKKQLCILLTIIVLLSTLITGCNNPNASVSDSGFYFDTIINITLYGTNSKRYIDDCFKIADHYEKMLSNSIKTSDISEINSHPGSYVQVNADTIELIEKGIYYGKLSNGLFDISIGELSDLWNFSEIAENSTSDDNEVSESVLPSDETIQSIISHINYNNILIDGNSVMLNDSEAKIDLGGIAKGFIADKMREYLNSQNITSGFINLGGNVLTIGEKSNKETYKIGIQKPFAETGTSIGVLSVHDASIVSSGIYERYYKVNGKLYHHILNPKTGYPYENNLYEVTIIGKSSVDGDALSTTCFALGLEDGMNLIENLPDTEAIFVTSDNQIHSTSGIGDTIPFEILQ